MRRRVSLILQIRTLEFRVVKSLPQGHTAGESEARVKAGTSPTPAPQPTPPWLTQLRGVPGRVPKATPQCAGHGPASLLPRVLHAGCSTLPCRSLLPRSGWPPGRRWADPPLAPKGGQGSPQLRAGAVDEGVPGDLAQGAEGCSELRLLLPATCLQPPVPIPVGMEHRQSLRIPAQEAQGPRGAAGDGPGQVAGGAVPAEGRRALQSSPQAAQHPQQPSQQPHPARAQPVTQRPGVGMPRPGGPGGPAHEAAARERNGNGARQTRCSGANEWSLGRGRKEVGVWGDLQLVTESTGWTGRRLAESALAEAHAPTHLGFLTAIQSPARSPAWTGTVGARALGPGAGPGEVYTSSLGRERAQGLRGGFWNSSSSPYPSGGCHTPRLREAAGPCIG